MQNFAELSADGWWPDAHIRPSPNHSPRPNRQDISLIVLHNISLPPFEYGGSAIEELFTNRICGNTSPFFAQLTQLRVSSHFLVRRCGMTLQFVSCLNAAHHAGVSQFRGRESCNAFSIGIELEGCDFEPFTETQYQTLHRLIPALLQAYPTITAITGHQHIAPNRKTDPGHFFDWQRLAASGFPVAEETYAHP